MNRMATTTAGQASVYPRTELEALARKEVKECQRLRFPHSRLDTWALVINAFGSTSLAVDVLYSVKGETFKLTRNVAL